MFKVFAGTAAGALIIALALVFLWPLQVRAAECRGQTVMASYYCCQHHGRLTASGERFDQHAMTAAHKTLPFGTRLRVSYRGTSVVVRVNDRGPFIRGRVLDLSEAAAQKLGLIPAGIGRVCFEKIG